MIVAFGILFGVAALYIGIVWLISVIMVRRYPPEKFLSVISEKENFFRLKEISHAARVILHTEDSSFFGHKGFNWQYIKMFMKFNLSHFCLKGGSTISQQLAKNMYLPFAKTFSRKISEAFLTVYIERRMTKYEIFETYLNIVYFGSGQYGIENAAKFYFDTTPDNLSDEQSSFFPSMLRGPCGNNPIKHPDVFKKSIRYTADFLARKQYIDAKEYQNIIDYYSDDWIRDFAKGKTVVDEKKQRFNPYAKMLRKEIRQNKRRKNSDRQRTDHCCKKSHK